jgi:hypothetical protein
MTANSGSLPKYCRHKASGQAYVWVNKKRHYLGVFGTTTSKEVYSRIIAELSANSSSLPSPSGCSSTPEKLTVVEVCAAYLDYAPSYYHKNGIPTRQVAHIKTAIKQLVAVYGSIPAVEFGPRALTGPNPVAPEM